MQIMGSPDQMGYDRVVSVFSPDGRLFQVQYAMEAVKRGATVIGIVTKDSVVLVADRRITTPLMVAESVEKVYKIDDHLCIATSGLVADGRRMIDETRVEAQRHRILYGEPINIVDIVRYVCDMLQLFTQYGGLRPIGVSLLFAGVKNGPRLFETDPSGTPTEWRATAIGARREEIMSLLEKEYKEGLSTDEGLKLALNVLSKIAKRKLDNKRIEVGIVDKKGFKKLSPEQINGHLESASPPPATTPKESKPAGATPSKPSSKK